MRRSQTRTVVAFLLATTMLQALGGPLLVAGQASPDSAALARADSLREALVQPPGSPDRPSAADLARAPFQLLASTVALAAAPVGFVLKSGIVTKVQAAREGMAADGVDIGAGFLGPRSWPAGIVRYEGLRPFYVEGGVSIRLYQRHRAGVALAGDGWSAEARGAYDHLREPHFWGVGPDSRAADRSDFSLQRLAVEGLGVWRPAGGAGVELSGRLGVERTQASGGYDPDRPDTDEVFPQSSLVGLGERLRFIRGEAAVTLDRTRIRRNQVLGHRAEVAMASYHGLGATDSGFRSVRADLAAYLPVNIRQALAFRLLAMDHFGERGAGVPFYLLAELGDDDGLRGFRGQRFRDRAMAAVQAEWRWETYYHPGSERVGVEAFVFGDAGMVASSFGELDRSPLRVTPGVGLRAIFTANRLAEGFLAFGGDNVRLSGSLSVTF